MPAIQTKRPVSPGRVSRALPAEKTKRYIVIDHCYGRAVASSSRKQIVVDVPMPNTMAQQTNTFSLGTPVVRITRVQPNATASPCKVVPIEDALRAMAAENIAVTQPRRQIVVLQANSHINTHQIPKGALVANNSSGGHTHASVNHTKFGTVLVKQAHPMVRRQIHCTPATQGPKRPEFKKLTQSFSIGPQILKYVPNVARTVNGPSATQQIVVSYPKTSSVMTAPARAPPIPRLSRNMANALHSTFAPDYGRPKAWPVKADDPSNMSLQLDQLNSDSAYVTL